MATWLKQSTSVDVKVGPFLDDTDGKTAETGLTITQPDIMLGKNGAAFAQKAAAQTLVHESNGWYEVTLDATDTDTLGLLIVQIHESGALPVWREFMVVPANIYDSFILGTDLIQADAQQLLGTAFATPTVAGVPEVDITHLGGVAQSATDLKDFADDGYDPATNKVQGVVLADAVTTVNGLAANVITTASIANAAITAAKFSTGALSADALASAAAQKIRTDFFGTADSGTTTTMVDAERTQADVDYWKGMYIRFTSGTLNGVIRLITAFDPTTDTFTFAPPTPVAVGTHTYEIIGSAAGIMDTGTGLTAIPWNAAWDAEVQSEVADALAVYDPPTNAELVAEIDAVQTDVAAVSAKLPAALVGGRIDASVGAMANDVVTAAAIANGAIDAATFAAGAIDAAAIATGAIDADALSADAVTEIWNKTMSELAAVPGVTGTVLEALQWLFLLSRNKITQTATTQLVRNDADSATIGTSTVSDDGTTFVRGEFA